MITVDLVGNKKLAERLRRLGLAAGVTMREVGHETMRIALQNCIKLTYPRKAAQGRDAVEGDIKKVIVPYNSYTGTILDSGNLLIRYGEVAYQVREDRIINYADGLKEHHERYRNRRGRVKGAPKLQHDKVHAKASMLSKYIRERKKHVGRLKKGWMPALTYFAKLARHPVKGVPAWVKKVPTADEGKWRGRISKSGNGFVEGVNKVPYMRETHNEWIMFTATATAASFLRTHARKMIMGKSGLITRFNSGRPLKV